ncbi:hypothetical protein TWF506_005869 [Arthrobotrys conoides]|uniref:Nephrocystin 3-like N-terminal domain-containing protein n=1 Tax=Arthrobotrys conoides TaxID=74498 RepID=A0AAN8NUX0_9PEZI
MEAVGAAASIIAIVELAGKLTKLFSRYVSDIKNAESDQIILYNRILATENLAKQVKDMIEGPDKDKLGNLTSLGDALAECQKIFKGLQQKLKPRGKAQLKSLFRYLKWPLDKSEIERVVGSLKKLEDVIHSALQIDTLKVILAIDNKVDKIVASFRPISGLPVVEAAIFGSFADQHEPKCLENTREQLLKDFKTWTTTQRSDTKPIFWLSGAAGTGKSTICRTFATILKDEKMLAASFFFKRGGGDRGNASKFVTTIAAGLSAHWSDLVPHIEGVVNKDSGISTKAMDNQFESLILQPLSAISGGASSIRPASVIVIDALDECDDDNNVRLLVRLLGKLSELNNVDIRVFITSRPETPITAGFKKIDGAYNDLVLHDIEKNIIRHDITIFFEKRFEIIVDEHDELLTAGWPGKDTIQQLVEISSPLFIVASTICRLLDESYFGPKEQLKRILEYQSKHHISKLGRTYLPVFDQLLIGKDKDEKESVIEAVTNLLGAILVPKSPMSRRDVSQLLNIDEITLLHKLRPFHSVLHVPQDPTESIRPYHLSFQEFLLDPRTKDVTDFCIDTAKVHSNIVKWCVSFLNNTLKRNICSQEPSWDIHHEREEKKAAKAAAEYTVPATRYACRFWMEHAIESGQPPIDNGQVHQFLEKHLLHWLELSTILDPFFTSQILPELLIRLRRMTSDGNSPGLSALLYEIFQFVSENRTLLTTYPLQIYTRAILDTSEHSKIRELFYDNTNIGWISRIQKSRRERGSQENKVYLPRLHGDWFRDDLDIQCIDFSDDRKLLCVSNAGTLWMFNLDEMDEPPVRFEVGLGCIAFANRFRRRENRIVVGTHDGEIRILDTESKNVFHILHGDGDSKCPKATSTRSLRKAAACDRWLASASNLAHSIRVWCFPAGTNHEPPVLSHTIEIPSTYTRFTYISFQQKLGGDYVLVAASSDALFRVWVINRATAKLGLVVERDSGPALPLCSQFCCYENQVTQISSFGSWRKDVFVCMVVGDNIEYFLSAGIKANMSDDFKASRERPRPKKIIQHNRKTRGLVALENETGDSIYLCGMGNDVELWRFPGNLPKVSYPSKDFHSIESVKAVYNYEERNRVALAASLSASGRVDVWDLQVASSSSRDRRTGTIDIKALRFSPDGRSIVSWESPTRTQIKLWKAASPDIPVRIIEANDLIDEMSIVFSADSEWIAAIVGNIICKVWSTVSGCLIHEWRITDSRYPTRHLAFSWDKKYLAIRSSSTHDRPSIEIWNLAPVPSCPTIHSTITTEPQADFYYEATEFHLAFSKDGQHLAWSDCGHPACISLYHIVSRSQLTIPWDQKLGDLNDLLCLFFIDDGRSLVWAQFVEGEDMPLKGQICLYVWDVLNRQIKRRSYVDTELPGLDFQIRNPQYKVLCAKGALDIKKWAESQGDQYDPQFEAYLSYQQCDDDLTGTWWLWNGRKVLAASEPLSSEELDFYDNTVAWITASGDLEMMEFDQAGMDRFEKWHPGIRYRNQD